MTNERKRQATPVARSRARELTERLCIDSPKDIEIELIASHLGATIIARRLQNEAGRLVRGQKQKKALIIVQEGTNTTARYRFIVAHELGHLLLHTDIGRYKTCSERDIRDYWNNGREAEANQFAAELLMPQRLFEKHCDVNRPCLDHIRPLAQSFSVSLTSAGIRFASFCPEPCAFVFSRNKEVVWTSRSRAFRYFIPTGFRLDSSGTYAGDFHNGKEISERPSAVEASSWTNDRSAMNNDLIEHSIGWISDSSCVLSLLWDPEKP